MEVLKAIFFVVAGFVLLIKGSDFFVDGAATLAAKLGIPQIVIGLTIVAFGTSAPEAAVSISAAIKGNNGISIGNVVGSNIMNILLILGITAIIRELHVKSTTVKIDMPFMILGTIGMAVTGMLLGKLNRFTGIVLLVCLVCYLVYLGIYSKKTDVSDEQEGTKDIKTWLIPIFIIGGIAAIVIGSDITVKGATTIAQMLGVSDKFIGLTIIAFGTSLPELMTSTTAARKGNADIAIGNIVGSNIFNIFFILGMTSTIIDLPYKTAVQNFMIDGFVCIGAALILWIFAFKKKLDKKNGIFMLVCYAAYFAYLCIKK